MVFPLHCTTNNHSPTGSSPRPAAQPGRAHPASQKVHLPYHSVIRRCNATRSPAMHYQQSLAQFAATGGATGPRATCVAGSPSTLPFSHLAPRCHRVTRNATGFQLEIPIFACTRLSPLILAVAHARLRERASGLSRCSTDHRGGPRIMRQDLWALQGHGQCDPLQTPAQVLVEKSHATSYYYIVCFLRF